MDIGRLMMTMTKTEIELAEVENAIVDWARAIRIYSDAMLSYSLLERWAWELATKHRERGQRMHYAKLVESGYRMLVKLNIERNALSNQLRIDAENRECDYLARCDNHPIG